jgi:hypothetical protein
MTQRSPVSVALLSLVTFGIYGIFWEVKSKGEMVNQGADIPTSWLIIVPFVNIYWLWKWSAGVEKVTNGQLSGVMTFVLMYLVGPVGAAIVQDSFNKSSAQPEQAMDQPNVVQAPISSINMPAVAPQDTMPQNPTPPVSTQGPQTPIQ